MTTIYIARNGQNEDNVRGILNGHRDLPLTDLGRQQARQLARQHPDQTVLLACHGDIGKMIYAAATSTPWRQVLTDFYFGNTDIIGPVDVL